MKIIFNTDQIYLHGGIEKVMAIKANYFASLPDTEVFVITTEQKNQPSCYPLHHTIKLIDLQVNYDRKKSYFSFQNISKAIQHYYKQKKVIKKINPDFIIVPNFSFDYYWLPFLNRRNSKVIKEVHSSGHIFSQNRQKSIIQKLFLYLNNWFASRYDAIVVLNKDEVKYQKTNNVEVIPNPTELYNSTASLTSHKVIAAGRIAPVKGFDQLIFAWKKVSEKHPDWELHIFGDDYLGTKEKLFTQIKEHNLSQVVHIKKSVSDLPNTMLNYSIYVMSSKTECFPMVLLEAMSVGLPIVSYDCPNGPKNIISNQIDGILVEDQQIEALVNGINLLIESQNLRKNMGDQAKIKATKFETKKVMQQWLNLFKKLKRTPL